MRFEHQRLDVYKRAIEFIELSEKMIGELPRGRSYLVNQLQRAALSVPLNIAEGAGEFSPAEKARFYRMARRSATECAACLDVCLALGLTSKELADSAGEILIHIVRMLTAMILRNTEAAQPS